MPGALQDSVVVVTGASSGIGRATAHAFAWRGAAVVLAARREEVLQELAIECENRGGLALAVPTDVADEAAVQALAVPVGLPGPGLRPGLGAGRGGSG